MTSTMALPMAVTSKRADMQISLYDASTGL